MVKRVPGQCVYALPPCSKREGILQLFSVQCIICNLTVTMLNIIESYLNTKYNIRYTVY